MFYIAGLYKFKKISNIKKNKKILQFFFIKKGIKNTKQAKKKNKLPAIDQKLPILEMIKHIEEIIKSIQPNKLMKLFIIFFINFVF